MPVDTIILLVLSGIVVAGGLLGVGYSAAMLYEAQQDLAAARRLAPERKDLEILGHSHVRAERNRLATQLSFVLVAIVGAATATGNLGLDWARIVSRFALFLGIVLVFANSVLNAHTRRAVLEELQRENGKGNA